MKTKITYRGWAGHFCCGHSCYFHLNTLIERGRKRIVVSTVGMMPNPFFGRKDLDLSMTKNKWKEIGLNRYYETMAFIAKREKTEHGNFWDADVGKQVYFDSPWSWSGIEDEIKAQDGHEKVVAEIVGKIERGEKLQVESWS